jgi:hypothetical protein
MVLIASFERCFPRAMYAAVLLVSSLWAGCSSAPEASVSDVLVPDSNAKNDDGGVDSAWMDSFDGTGDIVPIVVDDGTALDLHVDAGDLASDVSSLPLEPPAFPHLDHVVDEHRDGDAVWATFVHVGGPLEAPSFYEHQYDETGTKLGFWPASVIKVYTAVSALELIKAYDVSLDATATFFRRSPGGSWVEDISRTFRAMIYGSFNCSSNTDYTLLLRFAGIDWLNTEFFILEHGFTATTLMRGYSIDRPWWYERSEEQKIVVEDGDTSFERVHLWSGTSYADEIGCTIYNDLGTANCSSPNDMAEHMRRITFQEFLPDAEKWDVRQGDLDWLRYGEDTKQMNNKDCSTPWKGIKNVLPEAEIYHKGGLVAHYALGVHHVYDEESGTRYILALSTESTSTATLIKLSEEIARMALTPDRYVHLDYLQDYVNPVRADVMVYSEFPGTLELEVKAFEESADDPMGWMSLPGTSTPVTPGLFWYELESDCLSDAGKHHVRARLVTGEHEDVAKSDLHYVIVDTDAPCP